MVTRCEKELSDTFRACVVLDSMKVLGSFLRGSSEDDALEVDLKHLKISFIAFCVSNTNTWYLSKSVRREYTKHKTSLLDTREIHTRPELTTPFSLYTLRLKFLTDASKLTKPSKRATSEPDMA